MQTFPQTIALNIEARLVPDYLEYDSLNDHIGMTYGDSAILNFGSLLDFFHKNSLINAN